MRTHTHSRSKFTFSWQRGCRNCKSRALLVKSEIELFLPRESTPNDLPDL